jgi:hypothetical protein
VRVRGAAPVRELREEQFHRHQRRYPDRTVDAAAAQTDHRVLAIGEADHLDCYASVEGERLRGDDLAHAQRNAEIGAKRLPVRAEERELLDRGGCEIRLPQRLDMDRTAAVEAAPRQFAEAVDDARNPRVGERQLAPGHQIDLLAPLLLDKVVQPKTERRHRQAGQHDADHDRNELCP